MAGQTPDPSYPPAGQDPGLTQGRPAWQTPSYPGGSGAQAYAAPGPSYNAAEQGYPDPGHEQTYTALGQNSGQGYQGYQQAYPGYGAQQGQDQQWQAAAGMQQAMGKAKSKSDKGLVGSLLDFSFGSMVTPKIIKALYILFTIWTAVAAIGILIFFFETGGLGSGLIALIIVDPIFILLSLGVYRIILEAFMVIFQIHGELKAIREQGERRA